MAFAVVPATRAHSDAFVQTQAMRATTIAEYFVETDRVRVELEIGPQHFEAFRNLLGDGGVAAAPTSTDGRTRFFEHDLVISSPAQGPAHGRLLSIERRPRLERDPISGEPLATPPGAVPETVAFVRLEYDLPGQPTQITLHGLRTTPAADVGFVAYHGAVAVNDFRYLTESQILDLDWADPWYTRFRQRTLRRQYFAPMSGFVYVEPFEVRKEIVARPRDLQRWVDLDLAGRETLPVEIQDEVKRRAAEFLRVHQRVEIDGTPVEPELERVNFLERTLRTSRVVDPPAELDAAAAMLGVIFVYPTDGLPERVTMEWDLWDERIEQVPAASVDQAGALPILLEPSWPVLEWENFLKQPELPTMTEIRAPPSSWERALRFSVWPLLLGSAGVALTAWRRTSPVRRKRVASAAAGLALAGMAFLASRNASLSDARSREIVAGLLHNVYRAFDFRGEEQIYDLLARSASGELLTQLYLETRRSLELESQGGARVRVKEVALVSLEAEPQRGDGFFASATWHVTGSVGHWGHVHERRNRYRAELAVAPRDGAWKLVEMRVLDEERL